MARFVKYNDEYLSNLCVKKNAKNTDRATNFGMNLLRLFLTESGDNINNVDKLSPEDLNNLLLRFYPGVRTEKGEIYKLNSMRSMRFSIQRYFLGVSGINIIDDSAFNTSNVCFENVLKDIKKTGKGSTNHHAEIEPEDLQKLYSSFDVQTSVGLQEKVWLDVMLYLIRRGRENLRQMTKNTFGIGTDASGKQFVYQKTSELDKNHGIHDDGFDTVGEGRIYQTGGKMCPVINFRTYISHLHPTEPSLWQRPLDKFNPKLQIWYYRAPLGDKALGNMMAKLSIKYKLSERYTNHSIRVTSLQVLEDNNIEGRHVIRISGHKSTDSIKSYARRLSASRKRSISGVLSNHLIGKPNFQLLPGALARQNAIDERPPVATSTSTSTDCTSNHLIGKPNFQLLPDALARQNAIDERPPVATSTSTSTDCTLVGQLNDDEIFRDVPRYLLTDGRNSTVALTPNTSFRPMFNNCSNCTININVYQHK